MHRLLSALVVLLLILPVRAARAAAEPTPHNLLAHGDAQNFWLARVEQTAAHPITTRTTIYLRKLGEEGRWQPLTLAPVPARVTALASQNGLAAALLEDGTWMFLYPDIGPTNAKPLPAPARMVALAGGTNAWWAIGVVSGGKAALPASQPSTAPAMPAAAPPAATAASRPAITTSSRSAEERLVLFSFSGDDWKAVSELPEAVNPIPHVSLGIVDDVPYLADYIPGGVRVRHLEHDAWATDGQWTGLPELAGIKLLTAAGAVPRLWVEPLAGDEMIYSMTKSGATVAHLAPIPDSTPADRTAVIATGKLRMLAVVKGDVVDQDLLPQLTPDGKRFTLGLPQPNTYDALQRIQWLVVMIALIAAFVGSMRQRPALRDVAERFAGIRLAPLSRRFAAGCVDAAPAVLGFVYLLHHFGGGSAVTESTRPTILLAIYWSAGSFYVLYLTVTEALAGRSLGKAVMGLRIVGLDGQPAKPGPLLLRNILRVIEVGLYLFPLLIILAFPLRQRAGDVAAGTLVVTDESQKTGSGEEREQSVASRDDDQ